MIKMGTKTVSLSDDAYERLKKMKRKNESFSDVVRRITGKTSLRNHHGILSKKAGKEIEETIEERRKKHRDLHEERIQKVTEEIDK